MCLCAPESDADNGTTPYQRPSTNTRLRLRGITKEEHLALIGDTDTSKYAYGLFMRAWVYAWRVHVDELSGGVSGEKAGSALKAYEGVPSVASPFFSFIEHAPFLISLRLSP